MSKQLLIQNIIKRIEEVMHFKYNPRTKEEFRTVSKMVLNSILPHLSKGSSAIKEPPSLLAPVPAIQVVDQFKLINIQGCICMGEPRRATNTIIRCTNEGCNKIFHHSCMPWPMREISNFECPRCIILVNDPLNLVEEVLFEPSILRNKQIYEYKLNFEQFSRMTNDPNYGVEIRMIKLDGIHFFEQTWPDKCCIRVNGKVIQDVKPLHYNSSLKKRRDEKIFNRHMSGMGSNNFTCEFTNVKDGKNTKVDDDPHYVFTIVFVKKLTVEELTSKIILENRLSTEESKNSIKGKFLNQRDLGISEIKADLLCKLTYTLIEHPARGANCDHIDCFNLKYFIQTMEHNGMRKWICPLCRKRCYKLVVDEYIKNIIQDTEKMSGETKEKVFFQPDGGYTFEKTAFVEPKIKKVEPELIVKSAVVTTNNFDLLSITSSCDEKEIPNTIQESINIAAHQISNTNLPQDTSQLLTSEIEAQTQPILASGEAVETLVAENNLIEDATIRSNTDIAAEVQPEADAVASMQDRSQKSQSRVEAAEFQSRVTESPSTPNFALPLTPANIEINLDEYSPMTLQPTLNDCSDLQSIPSSLQKRPLPLLDTVLNSSLRKEKTSDLVFLGDLLIVQKNLQHKTKDAPKGYSQFVDNFQKFSCEIGQFGNNLDLLHRFVENRRRDINAGVVRKYMKLIESTQAQNLIYNDRDYNAEPIKRIKRGKHGDNNVLINAAKTLQIGGPEEINLLANKGKRFVNCTPGIGDTQGAAIEII